MNNSTIKYLLGNAFILGLILCLVFTLFMTLSGCGSGGHTNTDTNTSDSNGDLTISLTDAKGDFTTYTVDVVSLTLTKEDGAIVEVLPLSTQIDFAQYVKVSEILTKATIPSGDYTSATLTLDYHNSDIRVEDEAGDSVKVENIMDEELNPVSILQMSVQLEGTNSLKIVPGVPLHLTLDFDLNVSNKVEFDSDDVPFLVVEPLLIADLNQESQKIHKVRGGLKKVNVETDSFDLHIRPFSHKLHKINDQNKKFGDFSIKSLDDTIYIINEKTYTGNEGLNALANLDEWTAVVAIGDLTFDPQEFLAKEVMAGSSVPGGLNDAISGSVLKRDGNTLTVKGVHLSRADGTITFEDIVEVLLGDSTVVTKQFSEETLLIDAISPGQRVSVLGIYSEETESIEEDDNESVEENEPVSVLDATSGFVKINMSTVRGALTEINDETIAIDLLSINQFDAGLYDFSGTGTTEENDADPDHYEVFTSLLDTSFFDEAELPLIIARGFTNSFENAPDDFLAQTIIDVSDVKSNMKVSWDSESAQAFESIDKDIIILDLTDTSYFHHVYQASIKINLTDFTNKPVIFPCEDGTGSFEIVNDDQVTKFTDFETFTNELNTIISNNGSVKYIFARGTFNLTDSSLTADNIKIKF